MAKSRWAVHPRYAILGMICPCAGRENLIDGAARKASCKSLRKYPGGPTWRNGSGCGCAKTPTDAVRARQILCPDAIPLAKKMPGLRKYEISRGAVRRPPGLPYHLIAALHFDDLAAIEKGLTSPEGQAASTILELSRTAASRITCSKIATFSFAEDSDRGKKSSIQRARSYHPLTLTPLPPGEGRGR